MKAGKYWVGDLCYVLDHPTWGEVFKLTFDGDTPKYGEFTLPDGREFAKLGTENGDGTYFDGHGNQYPVDSGSIGCILAKDIGEVDSRLGNFITFPEDFEVKDVDGMLYFGRVAIDTTTEEEYEE